MKKTTLAEWLQKWYILYAKPNIWQSTAVNYECYIRKHVSPVLGDIEMSDLNLNTIQKFFNEKRETLSPKTLSNLRMMMHSAFKVAYLNDLIPKNYLEFVVLPSVIKKEMRVFTQKEQQKLLITLNDTDEPYAFGIFLCLVLEEFKVVLQRLK